MSTVQKLAHRKRKVLMLIITKLNLRLRNAQVLAQAHKMTTIKRRIFQKAIIQIQIWMQTKSLIKIIHKIHNFMILILIISENKMSHRSPYNKKLILASMKNLVKVGKFIPCLLISNQVIAQKDIVFTNKIELKKN